MIRNLTALFVLAAAAAMAVPASAEEMRLNLVGKTPAQAYAQIATAARAVCSPAVGDSIYSPYIGSNCVAETIEATLAKIGDPALLQYSQARKSFLQLASR
ncbi:MAG TPA: hypothetical protein VL460_08800 [Caulobacteraceae bacterium]|jgi:hypothetical protein|nr:hypothetical protein [Caulobacteraceae bacterium]